MPTIPERGSAWDALGGEPGVRRVVTLLLDRVYSDRMIGYLFRTVNRARLEELELQHASSHLGGPLEYRGRPLAVAHRPRAILGGHFNRRMVLLEEALEEAGAPEWAKRAWLDHEQALRGQITGDSSSECDPVKAARAAGRSEG